MPEAGANCEAIMTIYEFPSFSLIFSGNVKQLVDTTPAAM